MTEIISSTPDIEKIQYELKHFEIMYPDSPVAMVPFRHGDELLASLLEKWFSDDEVVRYLHPNTPYTTDHNKKVSAQEFLDHCVDDPSKAYFKVYFMQPNSLHSFLADQDYIVGFTGLSRINFQEMTFSRSIVIGETRLWNQGLAKNIGQDMLSRMKELGFFKANASANLANTASVRNLSKQFGNGDVVNDVVNFSLILENWPPFVGEDSVHYPHHVWRLIPKNKLNPDN